MWFLEERKIDSSEEAKSPHCVQMHYIRNELEKMMNLKDITITNYVVDDNELIEIDNNVISMSKSLAKLKNIL